MKISLLAFDGFTDLDLILHWDLLNRVKPFGGITDWTVQVIGTKPVHNSVLGLPIPTSGGLSELASSDGVILCSGRGTRPLLQNPEYLRQLDLDPQRQWIGAQCSGSLLLGARGQLEGVRVSAYAPIISALKEYGAEPVNQSLVIDGRIATASSCLAGQYLSRWLIESLAGKGAAERVMQTVLPLGES